jgi:hypothetical protein
MKTRFPVALLLALCLGLPFGASAEPQAEPADVESLDAILTALYEVISGPADKQIDWDRFRSLFIAEGIVVGDPTGGTSPVVWPIESYIETFDPILTKTDFWEKESARRTESFRGIAHVISTFEGRHTNSSAQPDVMGINSIQLTYDDDRWRIVSIVFQGATSEHPLPKRYLPPEG